MQAQSLTTAATTTATDAISLSRSFDSLSMDAEFINFLLDGPVEQQPTAATIKGQDTITQDPHAQPAAVDQFAFSDSVTEQNVNASRTSPIAAGMPLPPSPPSDGLALSSPSLDDPFAGLTDIFPLLNDLVEPALREEEEIDSGNLPNTTTASSSSTTTTTAPAAASLVKVKEEPKEPKRKSTKEKKASRAAKKQKLEPQPSEFIESLRGLNSAQLEHYAETQPLTEAQQTELKEWIRKIKNRESASLSRQNRKNHQQELEIQIEGLDSSNSRLREQITELQIENRVLKKELDEFKTLIERSNLGQAFALYNNTKKAAAPAPAPAPTSADAPAATAAETVKPVSTTSSAPVATATPAAPPAAAGGIQLSDVILKAMAGGQPNKEGMALVLYLLMALHSYGQYWNKVTAQHQLALSQPQPQPDEVPVQA